MDKNHLSHSTWDCKYHVVFGSKYRTKRLYGDLRAELRDQFVKLASQKGCHIEEGHLMADHVHMLISIPLKYSVAHIVGFLKGKTALFVANKYARKRRYKGYHFWARGYFVSTTGYMSRSSDVTSKIKKSRIRLLIMPICSKVAIKN